MGEIVQLAGVPPVRVGVYVVMAASSNRMTCAALYVNVSGAVVLGSTANRSEVLVVPAKLLAVIPYVV